MVNPPAFSIPGTCTSSHCPGKNLLKRSAIPRLNAHDVDGGSYIYALGVLNFELVRFYPIVYRRNRIKYDGMQANIPWFVGCSLFMA